MSTKPKKQAWVTVEPSGHTKASQSYDSVLGGCKKIAKITVLHTVSPNRGEETRLDIAVIKMKDGKFFTASFDMNLRRYQAEKLALGIAPWLAGEARNLEGTAA